MIQIKRFAEEGREPHFEPGQLVRHRRYGYRGVVVGLDLSCRADEAWYESNQTQPKREQPWYHVLVHGGAHTTYAAEQNLAPDEGGEPVEHPLVVVYFSGFAHGRYERNDRPYPD